LIFAATSSKDDLHRRIGGRCSSDNMKVVFKVCCRPDEAINHSKCEFLFLLYNFNSDREECLKATLTTN